MGGNVDHHHLTAPSVAMSSLFVGENKWELKDVELTKCNLLDGESEYICELLDIPSTSWKVHNPSDGQYRLQFHPQASMSAPTPQGIYTANFKWKSKTMRELGDGSGDYLETDGLEFKMKVNNCIPLFEWINQDADTQKLDEEDVLNEQPGT